MKLFWKDYKTDTFFEVGKEVKDVSYLEKTLEEKGFKHGVDFIIADKEMNP